MLDEAQSMESSRCSSHNNADSLYFPHTTSVEHTQSQYSPHADISSQNTTQSGDNCDSTGSEDTCTEMEDGATEARTDDITSPAVPHDNKSRQQHLDYTNKIIDLD